MTEPLADTWHTRDLPVLPAIVNEIDQKSDNVGTWEIASSIGMEVNDVERAIAALHRGGYVIAQITESWGGDSVDGVKDVTGEAYRATGAWPSAEGIADRLLATLEDLAEHGPDDVTKSKARKALDGLGSLTRDTLVSVAGAAAGVAMQ